MSRIHHLPEPVTGNDVSDQDHPNRPGGPGYQGGNSRHDRPIDPSRRRFLAAAGLSALMLAAGVNPAHSKKKIARVGLLFSDQGQWAGEASSLLAGFELYFKEQADETLTLEIIRRDVGADESGALEGLAYLGVKRKIQFLIGPFSLEANEKLLRAVKDVEAVLFVTNPSVRLVAGEFCLPNTFSLTANTYQTSRPLAPWALANLGQKVFLTGSDDWLGNEQADFFAHTFERSGGLFTERVMVSQWPAGLPKLFEAIKKAEPDFVYAAFSDRQAGPFLKAFRKEFQSSKISVVGPDSLTEYPRPLTDIGKDALGVRTLTSIKDPVTLVTRAKQKVGRRITSASRLAEGYEIAAAISHAVRQTSEDTPIGKIVDTLQESTIRGLRGKVTFDANHEPILEMMVREWELKGNTYLSRVVQNLGTVNSLDFGCGRVGFPKPPGPEAPPAGDFEEPQD
ncbi:MAG: ABC transporter substrate-binding protein [Thermodesulfobacteriota bacterium]